MKRSADGRADRVRTAKRLLANRMRKRNAGPSYMPGMRMRKRTSSRLGRKLRR